jgi:hypothetical protein
MISFLSAIADSYLINIVGGWQRPAPSTFLYAASLHRASVLLWLYSNVTVSVSFKNAKKQAKDACLCTSRLDGAEEEFR